MRDLSGKVVPVKDSPTPLVQPAGVRPYTHPVVASYYENAEGNIPTLYAWRILDYWKWTNRPNPDDYELRRRFDRRNASGRTVGGKGCARQWRCARDGRLARADAGGRGGQGGVRRHPRRRRQSGGSRGRPQLSCGPLC